MSSVPPNQSDIPSVQVISEQRVQFLHTFENRPLLRLFIRNQIAQRHDLTSEQKKILRRALNDGDVIDSVLVEVASRPGVAKEGMPFLDWLLEHADEIIALIVKIIGLF